MGLEGSPALYMNLGLRVPWLNDRMCIKQDNILQKCLYLLDTPYLMDHDTSHLMGPEPNSSTSVSTSMMLLSITQTSGLAATLAGRSFLSS